MGRNSLTPKPKNSTKITLKRALIFAAIVGVSGTAIWLAMGTLGSLFVSKDSSAAPPPPPPNFAYTLPASPAPKGPGGVGTIDGTSNLRLWYRTDFGLTLDGNNVVGWKNAAGVSELDLVNSHNVHKAQLESNAINGYDEVSFTHNSQYLSSASGSITSSNFVQNQTSTFVVSEADVTNQYSALYMVSPTVSNSRFLTHIPWGGNVYFDLGTCCGSQGRVYSTNVSGVLDYNIWQFDAHPSTGKRMYRNGTVLSTSPNTLTINPHPQAAFRLSWKYRGNISEVIVFDEDLNETQKIIIQNYLAAKYDRTIATDLYTHDNSSNGDFDHNVAGIGRLNSNDLHDDAQGTGILRMRNAQDLGDNEFLFWGHNESSVTLGNMSDVPSGIDVRLHSSWKASETDNAGTTVDVGALDLLWDLAEFGTFNESDVHLLVDANNNGSFADDTPISGAILAESNTFAFEAIAAITDGVKFTIGISNYTPPITDAPTGPGGVGVADGNSSLVLWLDASNTGGTDGAQLNVWKDQSGYGRDFTDGNGGTFHEHSRNGMSTIEFNGSSDYFERAYDASLSPDDYTLFATTKVASNNQYKAVVSNRDDPSGNATRGFILYAKPNSNQWTFWNGSNSSWQQVNSSLYSTNSWATQSLLYRHSPGSKQIYVNGSLGGSATNHSMVKNTQRPFRIGAGRNESSPAYRYKGHIGEIIMYDEQLNDAQRIIIDNYLSAKYAYDLSSNDLYDRDENANGDYDYEVAGIGKTNGQSQHTDAQGTSIVRINNPSDLDNGEFMFWGHDNTSLGDINTTDVPAGMSSRLARIWGVAEVNQTGASADVGMVDMTWDISSFTSANADDIRLLIDQNHNGSFADETPIAGGVDLGNGMLRFNGVETIDDNTNFTIGVTPQSSLPIELAMFNATLIDNDHVLVEWETASERNNDFFTIEKSTDGEYFEFVGTVKGAGNSTTSNYYELEDDDLIEGVVYYRLTQTDYDGQFETFAPKSVEYVSQEEALEIVSIGPNPFVDQFTVKYRLKQSSNVSISLTNLGGQTVFRQDIYSMEGINNFSYGEGGGLTPGTYLLIIQDDYGNKISEKLLKR